VLLIIRWKLRILRNGYTKQRLDIGIGIVRSSLSSDSSARKHRGWAIDPLGRMRLLGKAAGRGDAGCGSGPKRVDLVVFSQRRDFRSPRGLESGVVMYRSTGCRWAHGWIFLASPLSSILLSLYCFSYSRTCARCILYRIIHLSDVYNTEEAVNSAVRNHVSYNLQLSVCRNLAIHQTVYAYLHCLFSYAIDSPPWRIV
jgi:hypothetical protein